MEHRPQAVGPYRILRELGRGGMGVVYEIQDPAAPRTLALKQVLGDVADPETLLRFKRECELLARVRHPGVVVVHTIGRTDSGPYLVTELVRGESLTKVARAASDTGGAPGLEPRRAAELVRDVADAVGALHAQGLLHRDLKPDNVLVRADGSPVLLDFGLAREMDGNQLTKSGALLGTPSYMAPEQVNGQRDLDARVDVYGLGGLLYFLLAGRAPFEGASLVDVLRQVLGREPAWPSASRSDVPRDLEAICRKALSKERGERPRDAAAFKDELERWLRGERPLAGTTRSRLVPALLSIAALAVAAGLGVAWLARSPDVAPPVAPAPVEPAPVPPPAAPPAPAAPPPLGVLEAQRRRWAQGPAASIGQDRSLVTLVPPEKDEGLQAIALARFLDDEAVVLVNSRAQRGAPWGSTIARVALRDGLPAAGWAGLERGDLAAKAPHDAWLCALTVARPGDEGQAIVSGAPQSFGVITASTLAAAGALGKRWAFPADRVGPDAAPLSVEHGPGGGADFDVAAVAVSPDGRTLALGGDWRIVFLVDLDDLSLRELRAPQEERGAVEDLAFSRDGQWLAVVRTRKADGADVAPWRVEVWDARAGGTEPRAWFSVPGLVPRARCAAWGEDGLLLVGHDAARIWSLRMTQEGLEQLGVIEVEPGVSEQDVVDLVVSSDGTSAHAVLGVQVVAFTPGERELRGERRKLETDGKPPAEVEGLSVDVSPDGSLVVVAQKRGAVRVWAAIPPAAARR